ncbi:Hypothetical protein RRSL_00442 [Ralstonia solanacearum UW551]|uniref:Uncharacterized protein n=1 Tax=Ralstonia solanacearum (strain UW551) TaxID=342110 RepID=A0AB33VAL3_RALSU|nr:Hypothetical protein RRSL_00442 [Ralstonia solanacearum UW551]
MCWSSQRRPCCGSAGNSGGVGIGALDIATCVGMKSWRPPGWVVWVPLGNIRTIVPSALRCWTYGWPASSKPRLTDPLASIVGAGPGTTGLGGTTTAVPARRLVFAFSLLMARSGGAAPSTNTS